MTWTDRMAFAAQRITARIRRQLRHSPQPILLLTGGYDSRCIAAAAIAAGYSGAAYTSGPRDSEDVLVAAQVAGRLGLSHVTSQGDVVRAIGALIRSPGRLEQWARWTEGVDVIRQALPYGAFFRRQLPFPRLKRQLLHGFDGAMVRGDRSMRRPAGLEVTTARALEAVVRQRIPPFLALRRSIDAELARAAARAFDEPMLGDVTPGQRLTLFAWLNTFPRWGADMFSVRDLIDWHWTPYMDRPLIRAAWGQSDEDRVSNRFLVDLAVALAPGLAGVAYGSHEPAGPPTGIVARFRHSRRVAAHRRIWQTILLRDPPRVWDQVIAPNALRRLVDQEPLSEPLWCLATVELTARALASGPHGADFGSPA